MQSEQTQIHTQPARRKVPGWLLAFGIALLAAGIMFLPFIIYEKGNFFFFGDFNVQQIPFYRMAHDAVRSGEVLWNSYTDLGANFIASYSFYLLFSPFFWLTLPFPSGMVPYLMAPLLMLKTASMALTSYFYIRRFVRTDEYAIIGSLCYAFSGFATYNIFFNHFHEAMVFFPLLLIGVEELVQNRRRGVFALAVAVNCIVNYWFFIGEVVFVVLYVFLAHDRPQLGYDVKRFCAVALESVWASALPWWCCCRRCWRSWAIPAPPRITCSMAGTSGSTPRCSVFPRSSRPSSSRRNSPAVPTSSRTAAPSGVPCRPGSRCSACRGQQPSCWRPAQLAEKAPVHLPVHGTGAGTQQRLYPLQ